MYLFASIGEYEANFFFKLKSELYEGSLQTMSRSQVFARLLLESYRIVVFVALSAGFGDGRTCFRSFLYFQLLKVFLLVPGVYSFYQFKERFSRPELLVRLGAAAPALLFVLVFCLIGLQWWNAIIFGACLLASLGVPLLHNHVRSRISGISIFNSLVMPIKTEPENAGRNRMPEASLCVSPDHLAKISAEFVLTKQVFLAPLVEKRQFMTKQNPEVLITFKRLFFKTVQVLSDHRARERAELRAKRDDFFANSSVEKPQRRISVAIERMPGKSIIEVNKLKTMNTMRFPSFWNKKYAARAWYIAGWVVFFPSKGVALIFNRFIETDAAYAFWVIVFGSIAFHIVLLFLAAATQPVLIASPLGSILVSFLLNGGLLNLPLLHLLSCKPRNDTYKMEWKKQYLGWVVQQLGIEFSVFGFVMAVWRPDATDFPLIGLTVFCGFAALLFLTIVFADCSYNYRYLPISVVAMIVQIAVIIVFEHFQPVL